MIGIDTNILLRLMTRDDLVQTELAERLTSSAGDAIRISDIVLAELAWTLRRKFKWDKRRIVAALDALLSQATFVFENRAVVMAATRSYEHGKADLADYLIGASNAEAGVSSTFTFDQDAAVHSWFTLIEPSRTE
jgi:predicted nucleic-acid-binding protein